MAKKKIKKRVISKTESKLRNQRKYQLSKKNKIRKELNEGIEKLLKSSSKKVGKNITYYVPSEVKQHLGIKKKDYRATKQTILNAYYKKIYKVSNVVNEIEEKLTKRFKFKERKTKTEKRKGGEIALPLGFVWELDNNSEGGIFKNNIVNSVNGFDKKKSAPEILDAINKEKLSMSSTEFAELVGKKGNFRLVIVNVKTANGNTKKKIKDYLLSK